MRKEVLCEEGSSIWGRKFYMGRKFCMRKEVLYKEGSSV